MMPKIFVGTMMAIVTLANTSSESHYVRQEPEQNIIHAEVTAYTSSMDETDDTPDITASGKKTKRGIVACPRRYPFGTQAVIAGKTYVCQDRMNARYEDEWDIWVPTKQEALQFGRQKLSIKLL